MLVSEQASGRGVAMKSRFTVRRAGHLAAAMLCLGVGVLLLSGCARPAATPAPTKQPQSSSSAGRSAAAKTGHDALRALKLLFVKEGYTADATNHFAFSPDGKYLVTDYPALLDASTGAVVWEGKSGDVKAVPVPAAVFGASGQQLEIAAGNYGTFHIPQVNNVYPGYWVTSENTVGGDPTGRARDAQAHILQAKLQKSGVLKPDEQIRQVAVFRDAHFPSLAFIQSQQVYAMKPGFRDGSLEPGEMAIGLYDTSRGSFLWTRRGPTSAFPGMRTIDGAVAILADARVLLQSLDGSQSVILGATSAQDQTVPIDMAWDSAPGGWVSNANTAGQTSAFVDSGGRLVAFDVSGVDGLPAANSTALYSNGMPAIAAVSPDGTRVVLPLDSGMVVCQVK